MSPTELYLLRHPALEMEGTCYGQTDVLPSPEGLASIPHLAEKAAALKPDLIFSSDLQRCRLLAEAVAVRTGCSVQFTPLLREIHVGEWENRPWSEIEKEEPQRFQAWMADYLNRTPPGGETPEEITRRAVDSVRNILEQHSGRVLVVTHSGIIRVLRCEALGWTLDRHHEVRVGYGELVRLEPLDRFLPL
jgi:broad specificity phosphatase PhoE